MKWDKKEMTKREKDILRVCFCSGLSVGAALASVMWLVLIFL